MLKTSISDGISFGANRCSLILQPSDDEMQGEEFDSFLLNSPEFGEPEITPLKYVASRLVEFDKGIFVLGRLGHGTHFKNGAQTQETIVGPQEFGFLTDLKIIGNHLYAVGMWRQVYIRLAVNNWARLGNDILDERGSVDNVTGLRSIDGFSEDDIVAVGLEGEIWNWRDGIWLQVTSPTNVILEQVKAVRPNKFYAVGQGGVILEGGGDSWHTVEQDETQDDFWGLEWFNDALYLATATQLFRMARTGELRHIALPGEGSRTLCRLRTGHGALWAFAAEKAFWTIDGAVWQEAQLIHGKQ
jgi:hypothetical protein